MLLLPVCSSVQRIRMPSRHIHMIWLRSILSIHASKNLCHLFLDLRVCHSLNTVSLILCECHKENIRRGVLREKSRGIQVLPCAARERRISVSHNNYILEGEFHLLVVTSRVGIGIHYIFGVQVPERLVPSQEELEVSRHMESVKTNTLPVRKLGWPCNVIVLKDTNATGFICH